MATFDLIALVVITISILLSLVRGLVSEVMSIVAWVIAFLLAKETALWVAPWIPSAVSTIAGIRTAIAFVAVFIVAWFFTIFLRVALSKLLAMSGLGGANRTLGALFGLMRGTLLVALITLVCGLTHIPDKPSWREAFLTRPFELMVIKLKPWLPITIANHIHYPPPSQKKSLLGLERFF